MSRVVPRRLLVVTFHSQPGTQVGGLRWWGLSRHLAARGWEIRLLTANPAAEKQSVPEGMTVESVVPDVTLNDRYRGWRKARDTNDPKGTDGDSAAVRSHRRGSTRSPGALRRFRRELGGLLSFPDEGRGWLLPAQRAVSRRIGAFQPSVVVSSGPPHSTHLAVLAALRSHRTPWVADFRDPWSDEGRAHLDIFWAQPLLGRCEASVVRRATRVLTTTPELATILQNRFPASTVQCLPNGVDMATLPERSTSEITELNVVHLGTIYHRRDPLPVVRAFALFLRRTPEARRSGSRLRFIGRVDSLYEEKIRRVAGEEGILEHVELGGLRPRAEALEILARAGVSVVLAQDQGTAIPAKIYESVGLGIPTMVLTEHGSATAAAGRRLGAAVHPSEDLEGMARSLEAAWLDEWDGSVPSGVAVDYAELAGQAEKILLAACERRDSVSTMTEP